MEEYNKENSKTEEKKSWFQRTGDTLREHWKEIAVGAVAIGVLVGCVLLHEETEPELSIPEKPTEKLPEILEDHGSAEAVTRKSPVEHTVDMYRRRLPDGQMASQKKKDLAEQLNIPLGENETLVSSYGRGKSAA